MRRLRPTAVSGGHRRGSTLGRALRGERGGGGGGGVTDS